MLKKTLVVKEIIVWTFKVNQTSALVLNFVKFTKVICRTKNLAS